MSRRQSQGGFSIVNLVITLGVMSVVTTTMAYTITMFNQTSRRSENKVSAVGIGVSLQTYLADTSICTAAIKKSEKYGNTPEQEDISITLPGIGELAQGVEISGINVRTDLLRVRNIITSETNPMGFRVLMGQLSSAFSVKNSGAYENFRETLIGPMSVLVDNAGNIVQCRLGTLAINNPSPTGPTIPTTPSAGGGGGGPSVDSASQPTPATCGSVEQCAVYDWFYRNMPAGSNFTAAASAWMNDNANWRSIATSYVSSLSGLQQLNMLAQVNSLPGLSVPLPYGSGGGDAAVSGQNGNTIDRWVAQTVARDPQGTNMLRTADGVRTLQNMFADGASSDPNALSKSIFREAITTAPSVLMNSSLGLGTWLNALGYSQSQDFVQKHPAAAVALASNTAFTSAAQPGSAEAFAMSQIISYVQEHPEKAADIARGTGLWSQNLAGGSTAVQQFLVNNLRENGNHDTALQIAQGTSIASRVFGEEAVQNAIANDAANSAQIAANLAQFQSSSGWTTEQMQDYVNKNPDTWQADLERAVTQPVSGK